jgi:branched-chain amino acid transport system substrate-binding protein
MQRTPAHAAPVLGIVSIALLAGCGTGGTSSPTSSASSGGGALASCTGSVTVASDLPTSGSDASDGVPTQNGAKLAVTQANANKLLGGCTVNYLPMDDSSVALGKHDPQQGAQNISALAGNPAVIGVVGPFNSNVAKAEMPTANRAGLVMISPSNTGPGLTIVGSDPTTDTASLRPTGKVTYFRVCTTDLQQGHGLATAATDTLKVTKAYVLDDQETYGKGLADQFVKFFGQGGGTVLKRQSLPGNTKDFKTQLTEAKSLGADLVFFGGTSSNGGGIIRAQMTDVGLTAKFEGGDGIVDDEFFKEAGAAGDGSYGTIAAPDPTKLPSAAQFVKDYKAAYGTDPGAYSANAYDGMNILLTAAKKVITDNGGKVPTDSTKLRSSERDAVAGIDYTGAIGHTTFDANGDTSNVLLTLKVGKSQMWMYDATIQEKAG